MKLQVRITLFNALTNLIIIIIFILAIPFAIDYVTIRTTDEDLLKKKEKVLQLIETNGIHSFIEADEEAFGSYNILKEEFILIEPFEDYEIPDLIENTQRIVEGEIIEYRILTTSFLHNESFYLMEIGKSIPTIGSFNKTLQLIAIFILLSMLLLSSLGNLLYTKYLLLPLSRLISEKISIINDPASFEPHKISTTTTDIMVLDKAVDEMLLKIKMAFLREREFTANVSHELLTPIAILQNRLENMINDESIAAEAKIKIVDSLKTLSRLKNITNSLLLISRIENEHYLKTDLVILSQLLTEIVGETRERYYGKDVTATIDIEPDLIIKNCNYQLLHTLFVNLIHNSFKYSDQKISLHISGQRDRSGLKIILTDNGKGILPEDLPHIFNRFKRFNKDKKDGSGLGLSIVKAIADLHQFKLSCESEKNNGTVFTIEIPADYLS
jgi:signal transduction histidine kinase